ncbi:hypothetical protein [Actibacterium sp.]|uniref:hypothetical protein n=1 Tax=Actibacterium sp. TaxID=1872125 RepID=UPI003566EDBC
MSDPLYDDFYGRVRRVERAHRRGRGFEAAGTLGRSHYVRPARQISLFRPVVLLIATGMMLKAGLMMYLGETDYTERVARLESGSRVEAISAYIMGPDMVTRWLSELLDDLTKSPV